MKRMMSCAGLALAAAAATTLAAQADEAPKPVTAEQFVKGVSEANLAEINMAKLALQQSTNPGVQAFAHRMIHDHTEINAKLNKMADKDKMTPAEKMGAKDQQEYTKLAGLKGADFDRQYHCQPVADHVEAVALFKTESKHAKNTDVKAFAAKTLPTLEEHLALAKKLSANEGNKKANK